MVTNKAIFKIASNEKSELISLLESSQQHGEIKIDRISTWRSGGIPYAEILVTLLSAGSLAAIGNIIKAWLERKRGKIEITSEKTGLKLIFEGPVTEGLMEQLEQVIRGQSTHTSDEPDVITVLCLPIIERP